MEEGKKIRIANKRRYERGDEVDNYLHKPYHKIRTFKALKLLEDMLSQNFPYYSKSQLNVLELAGSTGYAAGILKSHGYNVTLNDIEISALEKAADRVSGLNIMCFDASGIFPIEDNTFHAIYAGEIIEHLFDTKLFLSECYRCLKPDGVIILTTPNLATIQDRIAFLFGKSPRQVNPFHEYLYLHIRPFTVSKLKEGCIKTGFKKIRIKTNIIVFRFGEKRVYIPYLGDFLP